jgi:hypothetical protein
MRFKTSVSTCCSGTSMYVAIFGSLAICAISPS